MRDHHDTLVPGVPYALAVESHDATEAIAQALRRLERAGYRDALVTPYGPENVGTLAQQLAHLTIEGYDGVVVIALMPRGSSPEAAITLTSSLHAELAHTEVRTLAVAAGGTTVRTVLALAGFVDPPAVARAASKQDAPAKRRRQVA